MKHLISLQYLDDVARAGSIRGAAEELNITSTALNRRILALEEELGFTLFERFARGVRPTEAGEIVLAHARSQLSEAGRLRSRLEDLSGQRSGHVRLACTVESLFRSFLPGLVDEYRGDYPGVTFEMHRCDPLEAEAMLTEGSVDLAIVFEPQTMTGIEPMASFVQPVYAVFSPSHALAARNGPVRLENLLPFPLALLTRAFGMRRLLETAALHGGLTLEPTVESNSYEGLRALVETGDAVTFEIVLSNSADDPLVRRRLAYEDVAEGLLFVGRRRGKPLSVATTGFGERLVRAMYRNAAELNA